jgi:hypothetical protein
MASSINLTHEFDDLSDALHRQYRFYCDRCHDPYTTPRVKSGSDPEETVQELLVQSRIRFRHCPRCRKWVCTELCWNAVQCQCEDCVGSAFGPGNATSPSSERRYSSILGEVCNECQAILPNAAEACPECGAKNNPLP